MAEGAVEPVPDLHRIHSGNRMLKGGLLQAVPYA